MFGDWGNLLRARTDGVCWCFPVMWMGVALASLSPGKGGPHGCLGRDLDHLRPSLPVTPRPVDASSDAATPLGDAGGRPVGMANLGRTCCTGSLLQAIGQVPPLLRRVADYPPDQQSIKRALCTILTALRDRVRPSPEHVQAVRRELRERIPSDERNAGIEDAHVHWEKLAAATGLENAMLQIPQAHFCAMCIARLAGPGAPVYLHPFSLFLEHAQQDLQEGVQAVVDGRLCAGCGAELPARGEDAVVATIETGSVVVLERFGGDVVPAPRLRIAPKEFVLRATVVHARDHYVAHVRTGTGHLFVCNDSRVSPLDGDQFPGSRVCLAFYSQDGLIAP